jgi:alpha-tubulin suppressor-like RCC1 family protein
MQVAAGQHCSLLQTVNGHVYYWGKHRSVGEATMRPTLVDALANNQHVVTHAAAGGQTVVCCTANAQVVAWGQGPYGELGYADGKKSSARPTFVDGLNGCRVASLACGYGHTLFVVRNDDREDKDAVAKLPELEEGATDGLAA